MFETLLSNPEQITFTVLFVALLVYVMKTNDTREKQYRDTIDELTGALAEVSDIKESLSKVTGFIYKNKTKME